MKTVNDRDAHLFIFFLPVENARYNPFCFRYVGSRYEMAEQQSMILEGYEENFRTDKKCFYRRKNEFTRDVYTYSDDASSWVAGRNR